MTTHIGIRLKADGEVSPTEEELIRLFAPAGAVLNSKYELIEYVNDVNREYLEPGMACYASAEKLDLPRIKIAGHNL